MRNTNLRDMWASLGIAFNSSNKIQADPEEALIALVRSGEFPTDKKMMGLALLWIKEYSRLVHVERLKLLSQNLSPFELALLQGIANKCIESGDLRWKTITKPESNKSVLHKGDSELLIKMRGLDADFAKFGVRVAPVNPENDKKLLPRKVVISGNTWLKNRLLFGSNFRADVASVKTLGLSQTAYGAAKYLRCSANSAYRSWKDLDEVGWK